MTNYLIRTEELCAWSIGCGRIRVQTRIPRIAEAISRLKETWPVGESVAGGYLRLFDTTQQSRKLRRTLERVLTRISPEGGPSLKPRGTLLQSHADTRQRVAPRSHSTVKCANKTDRGSIRQLQGKIIKAKANAQL